MIDAKLGVYRLKRELGRGAFGIVFEAVEEFEGQAVARVAVKIITPRDVRHRSSIRHELTALANLEHPNIVRYRGFGELPAPSEDELAPVYIALGFAEGGTLTDRYRKNVLGPRALLELARDAADGLHYLAKRGLTHRDIKPDNLLLFGSGEETWKVSDLGLAHPTLIDGRHTGAAGTMLYMAPEAWRGVVSPSLDVWALGLCLQEAATGQRLWGDAASGALEYCICEDELPLDWDALPLVLRDIVKGCLERDPARRISAAQVALRARRELESLQDEAPSQIVVSQGGGGTHVGLGDALAGAPSEAIIAVLPGVYAESVFIDKNAHIIGFDPQGGAPQQKIRFESGAGNTLKISGAKVTLKNLSFRGQSGQNGRKFHAVSVVDAHVTFINCRFSNDSLACLMAGKGAAVLLQNCTLEGGTDGILVQDGALAKVELSRITSGAKHGISAKTGAKVALHAVALAACGDGIRVGEAATAQIVDCQISGNGCGIHLESGAVLEMRGGKIGGSKRQGVRAERGCSAQISDCDARGNGVAWEIAAGAKVTRSNTRPA